MKGDRVWVACGERSLQEGLVREDQSSRVWGAGEASGDHPGSR